MTSICNNIDLHDKLNTNALKNYCSKVKIIPGTIIANIIAPSLLTSMEECYC